MIKNKYKLIFIIIKVLLFFILKALLMKENKQKIKPFLIKIKPF